MIFSQPLPPIPGPRIAVVGVTGSGKTTTARQLAEILAVPHIELDALHWGPNWQPVEKEPFRQMVTQALSGETWVTDGNYSKARDIIWARATTLVWLDYDLPIILLQLFQRTMQRIITREELWNGNRETVRDQFFSKDSLFLWAFTSFHKLRRVYAQMLAQPEYAHLQVIHWRRREENSRWLAHLAQAAYLQREKAA
jgi:adenylate kinase family enzyme